MELILLINSIQNSPTKAVAQFVCSLAMVMLVLSCLLICYNPRDGIEVELLKTGVMSEEDIDAIRRLKDSKHVATNRGMSISLDSIDAAKQNKRDIFSRKRLARISP